MALERSTAEPGLLLNPDWKPTDPGTFAVIIGVSRYRHLTGGDDPAPESYDLGQLAVSALTAFEVFRWLTDAYFVEKAPLAKCWLLLGPTAAECAYEPRLTSGMTEPTFENARDAIRYWWQTMRQLPGEAAAQSRAIFFFSGHGLEIHQDQQILLTSDYLRPPGRVWNEALATANLKKGLASLGVPNQFFFVDACRNGQPDLRKKVVNGAPILNEDDTEAVNPALVAPVLFATAPGLQAFQQPDPGKGLSLFGGALVDGLSGKPDIELKAGDKLSRVNLYPLQAFVKERVVDQLAASGETAVQPVKLSGVVDNVAVTWLKPATVRAGRMPVPGGFGRLTGPAPEAPNASRRAAIVGQKLRAQYDNSVPTFPWAERLQLFALNAGRWLSPGSLRTANIARTRDNRTYQVEFEIFDKDPQGYWMQCQDDSGTAWGCVLPADSADSRTRYAMGIELSGREGEPMQIAGLTGYLSPGDGGNTGAAAKLWETYRTADLGEAVRSVADSEQLRMLVQQKMESPLAAVVAALILVRANQQELLRDWLRNLAVRFPALPDGAVLWAEQLMRNPFPSGGEAATYLATLADRALPFTSEGFGYASQLAERILRSTPLTAPLRAAIQKLQGRIMSAMSYFQPGGLFASFSGFDPHAGPAVLLGPNPDRMEG